MRAIEYVSSGSASVHDREILEHRLRVLSPVGRNRDWAYRVGNEEDSLGNSARSFFWFAERGKVGNGQGGWIRDQVACLYGAASQAHGTRIAGGRNAPTVNLQALELAPGATYAACSVRAARIGELWFGDIAAEHEETAERICDWIDQDGVARAVVLGKLLVADILGKVPDAASRTFRTHSKVVAGQEKVPSDEADQLLVLNRLVNGAWNERRGY